MEEKVLPLGKFSAVAMGNLPPLFRFTKNTFWNIMQRQETDNDAKRNNDIQSYLLD